MRIPVILKRHSLSAFFTLQTCRRRVQSAFLGVFLLALAPSVCAFEARVVHVTDGDTVILDDGGKVRLLGINAPEMASDNRTADPYAVEARDALIELVLDHGVRVEVGPEPRDRYGRILGALYLESGKDVQRTMLDRGYAVTVAIPPNIDHVESYLAAESLARIRGEGLWQDEQPYLYTWPGLDSGRPGFQIAHLKLAGMRETSSNIYLETASNFAVQIPKRRWQEFSFLEKLREIGSTGIRARGWVVKRDNKLFMIIGHPSMLEADVR